MMTSYKVRLTVFDSGERLPMLIDETTGLPHPTASFYVLFYLRPRLRSWRTIDATLRAVGIFLGHVRDLDIDLYDRFTTGRYFSQAELDRLSALLQAPLRVAAYDAARSAAGGQPVRGRRSAGTLAIIVNAMARFVSWLIDFSARDCWATLADRRDGEMLGAAFIKRLRAIIPKGRGGSKRLSFTDEQKALLRLVTATDATSSFAQLRTQHWVDWGLSEGHRTGEQLNLRLGDVDFGAGTYRIERRPDAPDDPRREQPLVKGLPRTLDLPHWLALDGRAYVRARACLPHAAEHDFYFVSDDGRPLSRSMVTKTFQTLRAEHPGLGEGFVHHTLRHTWNEDFSKEVTILGYTVAEASRARAYAMGWRDEGSARSYRNRETIDLARRVSRSLQDRHMAMAGGSK